MKRTNKNSKGRTSRTGQVVIEPTKPDEAYFRHVDFIINKAEELGMFVGVLSNAGSFSNRDQLKSRVLGDISQFACKFRNIAQGCSGETRRQTPLQRSLEQVGEHS